MSRFSMSQMNFIYVSTTALGDIFVKGLTCKMNGREFVLDSLGINKVWVYSAGLRSRVQFMMLTQQHLFLDYCWLRNQPQQKPWKEFFSRVSVTVNTYGTCKSIKISGACRNWLSSRSASLCIVQRSIVCSIVWNTAIFLHTFSSSSFSCAMLSFCKGARAKICR